MKNDKVKYFINMFYYWCGRLELPVIPVHIDNRINCDCEIIDWDNKNVKLHYHSKKIKRRPYFYLIADVLHEIGHLLHKLPYDTEQEQITSEYEAEDFAVNMMKKYYPKNYIKHLKRLEKSQEVFVLKKKSLIHYKAFIKIKDYRNTIRK